MAQATHERGETPLIRSLKECPQGCVIELDRRFYIVGRQHERKEFEGVELTDLTSGEQLRFPFDRTAELLPPEDWIKLHNTEGLIYGTG